MYLLSSPQFCCRSFVRVTFDGGKTVRNCWKRCYQDVSNFYVLTHHMSWLNNIRTPRCWGMIVNTYALPVLWFPRSEGSGLSSWAGWRDHPKAARVYGVWPKIHYVRAQRKAATFYRKA